MTEVRTRLASRGAIALVAALLAGGAGYGIARWTAPAASPPPASAKPVRRIIYWYDPMIPAEHHEKPGLSSMGMQTIPRYADDGGAAGAAAGTAGVSVDPAAAQSLGVRLATIERSAFASDATVTGTIEFDQRDVAIVQARAAGFVQRTYARAPGDVVRAGAPLADVLVPEWGGAETEYLAVKHTGDAALTAAARARLRLLGIPDATVAEVDRGRRPRIVYALTAPIGGVIQTLDARPGVTLAAGATVAQITGLSTVWLNAAVPEAMAGALRPGQTVRAELAAFPGESVRGRVLAILPTTQADSRTLTLRIALPNPGGRLRPGMFATVHLGGGAASALTVPSEALIRTGTRTIVMLAQPNGRYQPVEVRAGREAGGRTEVLAGLSEGQKVVASGQFLLDSEASLSGIDATPLAGRAMTPEAMRR